MELRVRELLVSKWKTLCNFIVPCLVVARIATRGLLVTDCPPDKQFSRNPRPVLHHS